MARDTDRNKTRTRTRTQPKTPPQPDPRPDFKLPPFRGGLIALQEEQAKRNPRRTPAKQG